MAHCYHLPGAADASVGDELEITGSEAHHAVVARARPGEQLLVTSGDGVIAGVTVVSVDRKRVSVRVDSTERFEQRTPRVTLVQALAKTDRAEVGIAGATELGADAIVPWQASRSVSQWRGDKAERGVEKWRSAVTEAAKQSVRPFVPIVHPLMTTGDVCSMNEQLVVLHPEASSGIDAVPVDRDLALVVGPEGGVSAEERAQFAAAGAIEVKLGPEVLRTSTAGLAALAALSPALGRWHRG